MRACRIAGLAARLCLEMGMNRCEILLRTFPGEAELSLAVRVFWSVYTLDRRASFGTGTSFVIQDSDIDPALPEPVSMRLPCWKLEADDYRFRTLQICT